LLVLFLFQSFIYLRKSDFIFKVWVFFQSLLGILEIVVNRASVVCIIFAEYVKDLAAIVHARSLPLELKKFAVGTGFYRNYNPDSTIRFDVGVSWKICTRALFFIDKVTIPHSTVIFLLNIYIIVSFAWIGVISGLNRSITAHLFVDINFFKIRSLRLLFVIIITGANSAYSFAKAIKAVIWAEMLQ
jgi:hypothetical protein